MAVIFANNASSTLGAAITAAATTITIQTVDAAKFPSPTAGDFFPLTIVDPNTSTLYEIVYCTARSGNSLTVTRAREGTTAKAFPVSSPAELRLTAALIMVDAPATGATFGRNNNAWVEATGGGVGGEWTWNAGTAGPPATAEVRFNNATQNSATQLFISATNAGNANLGVQLAALETGSLILLQDKAAPTAKYKQFRTTGPTVNNSGWFTIPVAIKVGGGDLTAARVVIDFNNVPIPVSAPGLPVAPTTDTTDFNNVVAPGWHGLLIGSTALNAPLPGYWFFVQNLVYAGGQITQYAYPYSATGTPALGTWRRGRYSGVWSPWMSETAAGQVAYFARSTAPLGWLKANGALISRTTYAGLFAAIGTTWGAGDGSTTFALPDLRGTFIRGWDDARGLDTSRAFGSFQDHGVESHTHTATGSSGNASVDHTHAVGTLVTGTESADHVHTTAVSGTTAGVSANHTHSFADNASATGNASANHAHAPASGTGYLIYTSGGTLQYSWTNGTLTLGTTTATNSTGAAHTHTVAVAGTSGGNSVGHTHTFADNASSSGGRSAAHTHAITGSTAGHSATHSHTVAVTVAASAAPVAPNETRPMNYALLACISY